MVEAVILQQLEGIDKDLDAEVKKEVIKLLVTIATPLETPVVLSIMALLEKVRFFGCLYILMMKISYLMLNWLSLKVIMLGYGTGLFLYFQIREINITNGQYMC